MKSFLFISAFLVCLQNMVISQTCSSTFAKTIGSALSKEGGNSLAMDEANKVIYVAGYTHDSTLLIKMNADGDILWSRAFNVLKGEPERVSTVILDSDGHLVISGMTDVSIGGKVYLLKYDPAQDQVLWAKEYKSHSNNYVFTLIEKGPGENYLMSNNPFSPNDAELLEIDRATGSINTNFSKHYHLGSSQTLWGIVPYNGSLYATGRFTDGGSPSKMRTLLVQMDSDDGLPNWIKLGHRPGNVTARMYGSDLAIDQESIYSTSHGDPDGTDVTNDQMFIQKTSLSGEVEWIKHYQVPGTADVTDEILATGDGFVIMGRNRGPSDIFLFKINHAGDVQWARKYDFAENDNTFFTGGCETQLVLMDNSLYFTAYAEEAGRRDMILVKTDSEGRLDDSCFKVTSVDIAVTTINDAVYYPIEPTIFTYVPEVIPIELSPFTTSLQTENTCLDLNGPVTEIETSICMGDVYEGYDQAGTYVDTFPLSNGCDSIRILYLRLATCEPLVVYDLNACESYMSNGTNMDYTEFVPHYPDVSTCAEVSAGYLFRSPPQENKHSCTPGLNNSSAMCVSALAGCTYLPGHSASVVIEVTMVPEPASIFEMTGLQFYEKAPPTYSWLDGGSGPNNYPTLFGLRILKNGSEIYSNPAIPTSTTWNLKEFNFLEDTLFEIEEPTVFRIELLPYCPVGNGAAVSAWDLEDIVVLGGCVRLPGAEPVVTGKVLSAKGTPVAGVEIHLSKENTFNVYEADEVDSYGNFQYHHLPQGSSIFLKGYHNHDFLQGIGTLDLLTIQKHLLGKKPFTKLDEFVAADINHDGRVNISDLIALRKTLLGYTPYFQGNTSWRFGVWPQSLEGTDPSTLQEVAYIESLQEGISEVNFLGIKIGDLNGTIFSSAGNNLLSPRNQAFELAIQDVNYTAGESILLKVKATDDIETEGLQLAWHLGGLTLAGVEGNALQISDEHISFLEDGLFRLSWISDHPVSIRKGDILFTLTLIAANSSTLAGSLREINDILTSEIYTPTETMLIQLRHDPFGDSISTGLGYFTIAPNPFNNEVNIRFLVFDDAEVIITIYDASGKEMLVREDHYKAGEHILSLTDDDLRHATGFLFCRIVSGGDSEVKKVVRVE